MTTLETRTSVVDALLDVPYDPGLIQRVRRFGFEYEMLPKSAGRDNYDDCDEDSCDCSLCRESSRDVQQLALHALRSGMTADSDLHGYHCDCDDCDYSRTSPLMAVQEDCSVGVEFVSRICDVTRDVDLTEIGRWVATMDSWTGWMPDGATNCGNHVHVSSSGDDGEWFDEGQRSRALLLIRALYAAYDWTNVADGGCGRIRPYNVKPSRSNPGHWIEHHSNETFEHRLWNTPKVPNRLWAHIGISLGVTRWAFNAARLPVQLWTDRDYSYRLSDENYNALRDNLPRVVDGIRAYIPEPSEFGVARDVIGNLAPY